FTGRGNTFLSPSAGLVVADGSRRWRASVYRSFRAPTLNELFRAFTVGNMLTIANPDLRPETLVGGEAGVDWQTRTVLVRGTLFRNEINNLITNVTLNAATRQRQNFGSATTRGAEMEVEKVFRRFRASAAYLFVDARFDNRRRIPQVGKHQGSAQVMYQSRGTLASLGVRSYSLQFEDDLNRLLLPGFASAQLLVRQRLAKGFAAVASVENLLNRVYLIGFTTYPAPLAPTPTRGGPRLWRAGLRWESGR
ncbi:MAG: TonB-dependent receptor, partial [Acidobacteria bacterium]|nr:TonB-dependent receptor [Acidobacteriota bacterium]